MILNRVRRKLRSVRRRILITLSLLFSLGSLVTSAWIYAETQHEINELFDAELIQQGRTLYALIASERRPLSDIELVKEPIVVPQPQGEHAYERKLAFRFGEVDQAPTFLSDITPSAAIYPFKKGLSMAEVDGEIWHAYGIQDSALNLQLMVFQSDAFRAELGLDLAVDTLTPLLLMLPIIVWLGWRLVNVHFDGLHHLARQLASRSPGDHEPIVEHEQTEEVVEIVAALNEYLAQIRAAVEREKRFIADAAHELKTPTAAIQAALQSTYPQVQKAQVDAALQGTERLQRAVRQLLDLARIEQLPQQASEQDLAIQLRALLARRYEEFEQLGLALEVKIKGPVWSRISEDNWGILLENLIDNCLSYADRPSTVNVVLEGQRFCISNRLPAAVTIDPDRLTERFYRGQNTHHDGSGIGLSIVKKIVEQAGGELSFDLADGYFSVDITFA